MMTLKTFLEFEGSELNFFNYYLKKKKLELFGGESFDFWIGFGTINMGL